MGDGLFFRSETEGELKLARASWEDGEAMVLNGFD